MRGVMGSSSTIRIFILDLGSAELKIEHFIAFVCIPSDVTRSNPAYTLKKSGIVA